MADEAVEPVATAEPTPAEAPPEPEQQEIPDAQGLGEQEGGEDPVGQGILRALREQEARKERELDERRAGDENQDRVLHGII